MPVRLSISYYSLGLALDLVRLQRDLRDFEGDTLLIMAFDPGITTGMVKFIRYDNGVYGFTYEQLTHCRVSVWECLEQMMPDVVVYEDFVYQRRLKVELFPVEVIGVINLWADLRHVTTYHHTAGTVMSFWTDDKLRKLNLYEPSMPHAMDAMRHLMYHLVTTMKETEWLKPLNPAAQDTKPLQTPER